MMVLPSPAQASNDVDRAFGAQSRPAATRTAVAPEVAASARAQAEEVRQRVQQREREQRERREALDREAALRGDAGEAREVASDKAGDKAGGKAASRVGAGPAASPERRPAAPVVIRESWQLAGEMKSLVVLCPNGVERGYTWHTKTGRYCTPMMTCHTSQDWIHRALC